MNDEKILVLLDFFFKRIFFYSSNYFVYIFTIFFGDKFVLEHFFSNLSIFVNFLAKKIKTMNKNTFLNFFKFTLYVVSYISLLLLLYAL